MNLDDIDFDSITEKTVFRVSFLEKRFKLSRAMSLYHLRLTEFCAELERRLKKIGKPFVVHSIKGAAHVRSHEGAADYCPRQVEIGLRKIRRNERRMAQIDTSKLSEKARKELEHNMILTAQMTGAIQEVRRNVNRNIKDDRPTPPWGLQDGNGE